MDRLTLQSTPLWWSTPPSSKCQNWEVSTWLPQHRLLPSRLLSWVMLLREGTWVTHLFKNHNQNQIATGGTWKRLTISEILTIPSSLACNYIVSYLVLSGAHNYKLILTFMVERRRSNSSEVRPSPESGEHIRNLRFTSLFTNRITSFACYASPKPLTHSAVSSGDLKLIFTWTVWGTLLLLRQCQRHWCFQITGE